MRIFHSRTQHAVGQGGFHSGYIDTGDQVTRYVYDCGSTSFDRLASKIGEFTRVAERLDLLFLSHLDHDHVNGVDRLMDLIEVHTVVLPYLSPFERLVLAAEFVANGGGAVSLASLVDMLGSPARWFFSRGAYRVIFVGPRPGDVEPVGFPQSEGPPPDGEVTTHVVGLEEPREQQRRAMGAHQRDNVGVMSSGPIHLMRKQAAIWVFAPYVHPEPLKVPAFREAVARLLGFRKRGGPGLDDLGWTRRLNAIIPDRTKRHELARLYNTHIRKDRNLTTMTLFSGPPTNPSLKVRGNIPGHWPRDPSTRLGWIGTGDAHLDRQNRLASFERFHAVVLRTVGTIMLPHHGSKHNLKSGFIHDHEGMIWVASYGTKNSFGHPDPHLMGLAEALGHVWAVTEKRRTEFTQSALLEW